MEPLQSTLRSFVNTYQAIMWRLRECSLNDEQLGLALGMSSNAVRSRRAKPDLWKLSDMERLAAFFGVPATTTVQLNLALRELPNRFAKLPPAERRRIERLLLVKTAQLENYNTTDWPVRYLLRMHQKLSQAAG